MTAENSERTQPEFSLPRRIAFPAPVFIYHEVFRSREELAPISFRHRRYYLAAERLQAQLDFLERNKLRGCSLENFLASSPEIQRNSVVLTFDDGHLSNYECVYPMLKARNMSATFFAVAGWVGTDNRIGERQFREMDAAGMEIGSHGLTHTPLTKLSSAELRLELRASKQKLEQMLGKPVRHIAVPGGFIGDLVVEEARQAGYERVCSSIPGLASGGFVLHRLSVTSMMSAQRFQDLASKRGFALFKTQATYHAIQRLKGVVGVAAYERLCNRLLRRPSRSQAPV